MKYKGKEASFGMRMKTLWINYCAGLNRYPDPYQLELKEKISQIQRVKTSRFLGNGFR